MIQAMLATLSLLAALATVIAVILYATGSLDA
jgi:hypothetical protein